MPKFKVTLEAPQYWFATHEVEAVNAEAAKLVAMNDVWAGNVYFDEESDSLFTEEAKVIDVEPA